MHPNTLFLLAAVLALNAQALAQHYYYAPNSVHIPLLMEKNNASFGAGLGWGTDFNAFEVQGVYSPIPHGAVMFNYFNTGSKDIEQGDELGTRFRFAELAAGAYQALEHGSASVFAGVGQGRLYNNYGSENFSRFTLRRWFVQPSLAYRDHLFQCGVALRLSRLAYPKGESSFDIEEEDLAAIRKIEEDAPFFLPELGLTGSVRLSPFVLTVNLTSVFPDMEGLHFSRFNTNLTLAFDFGELARRHKGKAANATGN